MLMLTVHQIKGLNTAERDLYIASHPANRSCQCSGLRPNTELLNLTLSFLDSCPLCNWPSSTLPLHLLISQKKSLEEKCYLERSRYLAFNSRTPINALMCWPAATNEVNRVRSRSSKGHSKLRNTDFCNNNNKARLAWERPRSASVIHKVNYFIQLKTPLIFRNVIFWVVWSRRERERYPSRHQLLTKAYIATPQIKTAGLWDTTGHLINLALREKHQPDTERLGAWNVMRARESLWFPWQVHALVQEHCRVRFYLCTSPSEAEDFALTQNRVPVEMNILWYCYQAMIGSTGVHLHSKLPVVQKKKFFKSSRHDRPLGRLRAASKSCDVATSASRGWSQGAGKGIYGRLKACKSHIHQSQMWLWGD